MRISKVRDYISTQILSIDNSLEEWNDVFNIDNIGSTIRESRYHIAYSVPSIETENVAQTENISATINFFFKSYRDTNGTLDAGMDKVNDIKQALVCLANIEAYRITDDWPIQSCIATSIVPAPLDNNDNAINITLEIELSVIEFTQ